MARGSGDESKEKRKPGCGALGAAGIGASGQKMLVGVVWSCADMKLLLFTLVVLFALLSLAPLLPPLAGLLPASSDLRACISRAAASSAYPAVAGTGYLSSEHSSFSARSPPMPENYHHVKGEVTEAVATGPNGASAAVVKRSFNPVGSAAYLFIQMGAYRGGPNTFAVVGLASKPLHVFGKPTFQCEWIPHGNSSASTMADGRKILPDWGYGRVYSVVVVNCTFEEDVGADGSGGRLVISANAGGGFDTALDATVRIEALLEAPGSVDALSPPWATPPKYDYLYCGSPMYGNLSPQRVREWLAYHAKLFGGDTGRAHFVLHDAGGAHPGVMEVLQPWMEKGMVTLQDVREQERFDGYYHNQFLVVNDCLHRHRFAARWIFFFDVDEFLYVEPRTTLGSLLAELSGYAQFTFEQMPMSANICLAADAGRTQSMWGMEKLVYRDVKRGVRRDRKYAIQPRSALAAGVHLSQHAVGGVLHRAERRIRYFHYHGTVADRREPCRDFANVTQVSRGGTPYVFDGTLRALAASIKRFELRTIGPRLRRTRQ